MRIYIESLIIIFMVTTIGICKSFTFFCPEGEEFSVCGKNDCEPTCRFPRGPKNCTEKCRPGCICYKTLVRREKDKKCITLEECSDNYQPRRPPSQTSELGVPPRRPEGPTSRRQGLTGRAEGPTSRLEGPKSSPRCAASRPGGPPRRSSSCPKGWPVFPPPEPGCTPGTFDCSRKPKLRPRTGRGKDEFKEYQVRPIFANAGNRNVQGTFDCPRKRKLRLRTGRRKDEFKDYHVRPIFANTPIRNVQVVKPEVLDELLASGQYDKLADLLGIDRKCFRDHLSGGKRS